MNHLWTGNDHGGVTKGCNMNINRDTNGNKYAQKTKENSFFSQAVSQVKGAQVLHPVLPNGVIWHINYQEKRKLLKPRTSIR